jgi:uncharacterized membrane protein (Fun14 family)
MGEIAFSKLQTIVERCVVLACSWLLAKTLPGALANLTVFFAGFQLGFLGIPFLASFGFIQ